MTFIMIFIAIANIIAIAFTYISLGKMQSKQKLIGIVVSFAIMYTLVLLIYSMSSGKIESKEIAQSTKDFIIFAFVPVNSIIVLPYLAKSYQKYAEKKINQKQLKSRAILIGIVFIIVLISEFFYFGNIQNEIANLIKQKQESTQNGTNKNMTTNTILNNEIIQNGMNQITNQIQNQVR